MTTSLALPEFFIGQMKDQLGEEAPAFLHSYDEPRTFGLRLNPLKLRPGDEAAAHIRALFALEPVPWCEDGYYYGEMSRPGKHSYHAAGLYYIQEPSAMSSVELLQPQPGDIVLDLAGAPGGKSTQIAGKLQGQGLLVANEIHPARAKILSENIERMGIANAIVTSEPPDRLAAKFPQFFDKIMLDAPCSGEGMFRKDPDAITEWSPDHVAMCAARQSDILNEAAKMLKPGGVLAYSTCTFNREENERTIERFVREHPAFEVERTERIWPHRDRGEGHFVAVLRCSGTAEEPPGGRSSRPDPAAGARGARRETASALRDALALFEQFRRDAVPELALPAGEPLLYGGQLYWLPVPAGSQLGQARLAGLKVLRPGLHLAEAKKGRAEPAHALALALPRGGASRELRLAAGSAEAAAYLRGETLPAEAGSSGWLAVSVDGYPLGWGKASGGQVKNHYPKGLRWL
ncbi:RsmB/NOP family class I SAM-dependent RNA methyltransferase [Paenibacillus thalictri]|uniref:RNA methyltransferase n=1 Tax=Paenibacillus thalictri TaxID=2527873 RepID=A0A4V2J4V5_9BACL|nr:RsmB/NOP family class I SAM-dependent RNA methyltransferase [Paenibacillus thalictri]TBL81352.1 RNA methyltransferase [Paenibacillus thalictri]